MKEWIADREAYKLFHDATIALSQIEANGIRVDEKYLDATILSTESQIKELNKELHHDAIYAHWRKRYGLKTNMNSPQQLSEVIFNVLGYDKPVVVESGKKRRKDQDKLAGNEAMFAEIDLPFIHTYFKMKKLQKSLSTYLLGIKREICDGYIHPNYNLNVAVTYRSSCDNPNIMNQPKRNKVMAEIVRRCFIARPGQQLGEVDYATAEVRMAACYNKDPKLIRYLKDPHADMHGDTACDIFMLRKDQLDPKDKRGPRDATKNQFVFPEFFGSVYFQCAPNLWQSMMRRQFKVAINGEITEDSPLMVDHLRKKGIKELGDCDVKATPRPGTFVYHVQQVERIFWEQRFPAYARWKRDYYREYLNTGGLKMHTGFVCFGVFKRNDVLDYAIQGSAFHCLLWSLTKIQKWLVKNRMLTKIIGQIHDCIFADIHPSEKDDFFAYCRQVMTVDLLKHWPWIIVPMDVEFELSPIGGSWYELEKVK